MGLLTPRRVPDRRLPGIAGGLVVVLALPVFLAAGWAVSAWALGAGLWVASPRPGLVLGGRGTGAPPPPGSGLGGIGAPTLSGSGVVVFGMLSRGILLMVALIVVAGFDAELALGAALVYAAAFTTELALSITSYYSGGTKP